MILIKDTVIGQPFSFVDGVVRESMISLVVRQVVRPMTYNIFATIIDEIDSHAIS